MASPTLGRLYPGEIPRYSFYRRLSVPQDQSGHEGVKKNLHPSDTRDRTRAVQPLVKRLAAWATWPIKVPIRRRLILDNEMRWDLFSKIRMNSIKNQQIGWLICIFQYSIKVGPSVPYARIRTRDFDKLLHVANDTKTKNAGGVGNNVWWTGTCIIHGLEWWWRLNNAQAINTSPLCCTQIHSHYIYIRLFITINLTLHIKTIFNNNQS